MKATVHEQLEQPLRLSRYISGFVLSVALTMAAYLFVTRGSLSHTAIVAWISGLALTQFVVQLVLFLHLGEERRPRWKLGVLVFMVGIVLILVAGSIWIMNNMNYRMTPLQTEQYLHDQDGGI